MTNLEYVLLLIYCAAALAVLGPQRKRINTNPMAPANRPTPPLAPPPVVAQYRKTSMEMRTSTKPQMKPRYYAGSSTPATAARDADRRQ